MNSLKHITKARKLSSLETIELAMDDVCRTLDIDGAKAFFTTLSISVLASNIIRHGSSSKWCDELTVEVFSSSKSITVVLDDRCDPIPKAVVKSSIGSDGTISEYDTTLCNLPEFGWGLDLVHSAASSVLHKGKQHRNVYEVAFELMSAA